MKAKAARHLAAATGKSHMANTNTRRQASNKALGAIAGAMVAADPWPIPARGRGVEQARPLIAGEKDQQGIGRTVDKLVGNAPQVTERLTPVPDAMSGLEQATSFLDQVLETLEHRLESVLMAPPNITGATAEHVPDFCELSGRIEHQARRVRSSNERLLALLDRLAL